MFILLSFFCHSFEIKVSIPNKTNFLGIHEDDHMEKKSYYKSFSSQLKIEDGEETKARSIYFIRL